MIWKLTPLAAVAVVLAAASPSHAQLARPTGYVVEPTVADRAPITLQRSAMPPPAQKQGDMSKANIPVGVQNKKQALMNLAGPLRQGAQVVDCDPRTLDLASKGEATVMGDLMIINNAKTVCPTVGKTFKLPPGMMR